MAKITTVIIGYEASQYLKLTLNSIEKALSKSLIQVVLVNDGSLDATGDIMHEFANRLENVTYYNYHENRGLIFRQNQIIQQLQTDIVHFLSSDDLILEDAYNSVNEIFSKYRNIHFLCGRTYIIDEFGNYLCHRPLIQPNNLYNLHRLSNTEKLKLFIDGDCYFFGNVTFWNLDFLKKSGGFNQSLYSWADGVLTKNAVFMGQCYFLNEFLGCFRRHKNNWSNSPIKISLKEFQQTIDGFKETENENLQKLFSKYSILRNESFEKIISAVIMKTKSPNSIDLVNILVA